MAKQHLLYVAFLATLLVPHILANEPGPCDVEPPLNCTACLALAPDCSWFVCEQDGSALCANATAGAAEGCHPGNATDCTVPTTMAPQPTPGPTPAPRTGGFSFGSFVGGMVFCMVIFAGVFVGLKIYRRRQAMTGRYNNL
ncbi:hypothetical protein FJT64_019579 [Amphibalanus amphitrite]|uniref:Uncharacterized protein n=1 Tax=Amphibalanus amphitrite TaxID=1232801 RepID=A0A6A4WTG5_AMPAM|nr:hypothetical protein FJT64_019579 [Amphibalanus amphitrite]KAF0309294.1 hypothetical protein FJT64_019579 [Amphibalanus amphitrite]